MLRIAQLCCLALFSVCLLAALAISHDSVRWEDLSSLLAMRVKVINLAIYVGLLGLAMAVFSGPARFFEAHRLSTWPRRVGETLLASSLLAGAVGVASSPLHLEFATPEFLATFWILLTGALIASREAFHWLRRVLRHRTCNFRQLVLIAPADSADRLLQLMEQARPDGFRIAAVLRPGGSPSRLTRKLRTIIRNQPVDEVFISLPVDQQEPALPELLDVCEQQGILVRLHAIERAHPLSRLQFDRLARVPVLTLQPGPPDDWQLATKRVVDLAGALTLLLLLSPLLAIVAVAIKLDSAGPILFRQARFGYNKRRFAMLKFRTMVADAESRLAELEALNEADGPVFKLRHDPRVTRVGRWLRRFSLDELPQLINVVRGEMSLVGPRPLPPRDVERIAAAWHRRRFSVKPGLTCLWQVSGRSDLSFDRWVRLDLEYIDRWSLGLDVKILLRTVPAVLRGSGAY